MNKIQEIENLLKNLFVSNISNLDNGFYKFLNFKQKKIKEFIENLFIKYNNELDDDTKYIIYNYLYKFFSRYYNNGKFDIKNQYIINDDNKNDIIFTWKNKDQYYIKNGLLFHDYNFKIKDYNINFYITSITDNSTLKKIKANRFFVLNDNYLLEYEDNKTLNIYFQYKKLNDDEIENYNIKNEKQHLKQKIINQIISKKILDNIKNKELKLLLSKNYQGKPIILIYLNKFVNNNKKNDKDFFIHKDLKGFLSKQFEFFIKDEILSDILKK